MTTHTIDHNEVIRQKPLSEQSEIRALAEAELNDVSGGLGPLLIVLLTAALTATTGISAIEGYRSVAKK